MGNNSGNIQAEQHLVERVLNGDVQAFGIIIKSSERLVAQIVFKMIPNAEDRKDLAQDIYLKVFNKLGGFKFQSRLSTWIAQIAWNTCVNWLEKKRLVFPGVRYNEPEVNVLEFLSDRSVSTSDLEAENMLLRKQVAEMLQQAIETLPPMYKTLVMLYHHEEMGYDELGQVTGLPVGTVKSYLFRARKMLKDKLTANNKKEAL